MRFRLYLASIVVFVFVSPVFAQEDIQIGSDLKNRYQPQGGLFDYSDPTAINIKVQLWGYVKYPGYYIIPSRSSINDLLSLAGGPLEAANLDDTRILRSTSSDSSKVLFKFDYNALLWEDSLNTTIKFPKLLAGDVVLIPGEPKYFVREDVSFYVSIITALASITALIISITN